MKVGVARATAYRWVTRHGRREAGFAGAYYGGSTSALADDAELPDGCDLDIIVAVRGRTAPISLGTFLYHGVLLEVNYLPWARLAAPEAVLASYELAAPFRTDPVILDPIGQLSRLHRFVAHRYAGAEWVRRRCEGARAEIEHALHGIDATTALPDQVGPWLVGTGLTARLILTAGLRHPRAHRRYVTARRVLAEHDRAEVYPELLELLGCVHLSDRRVQHHLDTLARTFDAAVESSRSQYFIGTEITPVARPIVIDGTQALIDRGHHREAMFGIIATFAQCHAALQADASREVRREHAAAFESVLADLNLNSSADLMQRATAVVQYLPALWKVVERILADNPRIR